MATLIKEVKLIMTERDAKDHQRLVDYFEKSKKRMHGYDNVRVREVFAVNILLECK